MYNVVCTKYCNGKSTLQFIHKITHLFIRILPSHSSSLHYHNPPPSHLVFLKAPQFCENDSSRKKMVTYSTQNNLESDEQDRLEQDSRDEDSDSSLNLWTRVCCGLWYSKLEDNIRDFSAGTGFKVLVAFTLLDMMLILAGSSRSIRVNDLINVIFDLLAIAAAFHLKRQMLIISHQERAGGFQREQRAQTLQSCEVLCIAASLIALFSLVVDIVYKFVLPKENWDDINPSKHYVTTIDIFVTIYWQIYFCQTWFMLRLEQSRGRSSPAQ